MSNNNQDKTNDEFNKSGKIESSVITYIGLVIFITGLVVWFVRDSVYVGAAIVVVGLIISYIAYYEFWANYTEFEGRHVPIGHVGVIKVGRGKKFRVAAKGNNRYFYFGFNDSLRVKYDVPLSKQYIETGKIIVKGFMYAKINVLHTCERGDNK